MLAFGVTVLAIFSQRLRGQETARFPAAIISLAFMSFGTWALLSNGLDPFFLVFIVPGVLLAIASTGGSAR